MRCPQKSYGNISANPLKLLNERMLRPNVLRDFAKKKGSFFF